MWFPVAEACGPSAFPMTTKQRQCTRAPHTPSARHTASPARREPPDSSCMTAIAGSAASRSSKAEAKTEALRSELARNGEGAAKPDALRVIVLMCHEERVEVFALLAELGAKAVDVASELTTLIPRLQGRPRRG